MPERHPGYGFPGRVTSPSHALFCSVIRIDAASRRSTCETSPRNGRCSVPPIQPVRRGLSLPPASRAPTLLLFSSVQEPVHLDTSVPNSPARHSQPPERLQLPARQNPEKDARLEIQPTFRHP